MCVRFRTLLGLTLGAGFASAAGAGELGYPASALGEFSAKPRSSFENAPPLAAPVVAPLSSDPAAARTSTPPEPAAPPAAAPAPLAQAEPGSAEPSPPPKASPEPTAGLDEYEARCFVKIDGRVLTAKVCRILKEKEREVIFEIEEGPLTIRLRQGRVWTARLKERDFGNVYKTGSCWGARGFYACDRGRI